MSKLLIRAFSISLDGYGAGPNQSLADPLGENGETLHELFLPTKTFRAIHGQEGGVSGIDDDFARLSFENIGAWILGRNMFGPVRGPWPDESWKGWWGDNPPYHVPVFVLTHHPRPSLAMEGGTVFHFVTDGIESALRQAKQAAQGKDVRLGGGVATIQEYLSARLVDELHIAVSPVLLGKGEHLFAGIDLPALGYALRERVSTPAATHLMITMNA
jgi:dihydrofolate reductase